jgi:hypothetical protein
LEGEKIAVCFKFYLIQQKFYYKVEDKAVIEISVPPTVYQTGQQIFKINNRTVALSGER